MPADERPRERMIRSAAVLMRERGIDGTSFSQVLRKAGAPRGSIYHYFPGGKMQLIEEATRYGGDFIAVGLATSLEQNDPVASLDLFEQFWRSVLEESEFEGGCPIAAATLGGDRVPEAQEAAAAAFNRWQEIVADALVRRGVTEERARSVSAVCFAATEGAVIMARAERSLQPLARSFAELRRILADVLAEGAAPDESR